MKRFVSVEEINDFRGCIKQCVCPFCNMVGKLIFHGYLRGYSECSSEKVIRGHRIFCNNRKKSKGCGRTFSLLLLRFIRGCIIGSRTVTDVIKRLLDGETPAVIARYLPFFSSGYIYRFISGLRRRQSFLRGLLLKLCPPFDCKTKDPLLQTMNHLFEAFSCSCNPVRDFQSCFQVSFL